MRCIWGREELRSVPSLFQLSLAEVVNENAALRKVACS